MMRAPSPRDAASPTNSIEMTIHRPRRGRAHDSISPAERRQRPTEDRVVKKVDAPTTNRNVAHRRSFPANAVSMAAGSRSGPSLRERRSTPAGSAPVSAAVPVLKAGSLWNFQEEAIDAPLRPSACWGRDPRVPVTLREFVAVSNRGIPRRTVVFATSIVDEQLSPWSPVVTSA